MNNHRPIFAHPVYIYMHIYVKYNCDTNQKLERTDLFRESGRFP